MSDARARVEVDLDAIRSNLRIICENLRRGETAPEICIVVKADAFGHGIDLVMPLVVEAGLDAVGIVSTDEARQVRELGFTGRILRVRAGAPAEIIAAAGLDVEEWAGGNRHARAISDIALQSGVEIPIHLSLNSAGISKECLDLDAPHGQYELRAIAGLRGLVVRGICAHFPTENAGDVRAALPRFRAGVEEVIAQLGRFRSEGVQVHCATSFAAIAVPESRFDLVRIGAAVYGDTSAELSGQRGAMRVVAPVTSVSRIPAGRAVGYGGRHVVSDDALIATIPLGYSDGFPRILGGRGDALVHGRRAPILDRFAMNSLALDVTGIPGVVPGDEVVIYGRQGGREITSAEFEERTGMLAAEGYTLWGRLLPRVARQKVAAASQSG